jgi:hypothetical protein
MLETFCACVNFKSLLLQHDDIPVVQKYRTIIEQAAKDRSRDPFAGVLTSQVDVQATHAQVPAVTPPKRRQQGIVLSERAVNALSSIYQALFNHPLPPTPICHSKHFIGKISFTTRTESNRDCNVFFRSVVDDIVNPGIIQYIVSVPSPSKMGEMVLFFVIERFAPLPDDVPSGVFSSHMAFGASLWSSKMSPVLEAVPTDHVICHAIFRPSVKGTILFKALNRVRIPWCAHFLVAHKTQGCLAFRQCLCKHTTFSILLCRPL